MPRRLFAIGVCLALMLFAIWFLSARTEDGPLGIAPPALGAPHEPEATWLAPVELERTAATNAPATLPPEQATPAPSPARPWRLRVVTRYDDGAACTTWGASVVVTSHPIRTPAWRDLPKYGYRHGAAVWSPEEGPNGELVVLGAAPLYATLILGHVVMDCRPIDRSMRTLEFTVDNELVQRSLGRLQFHVVRAPHGEPCAQWRHCVQPAQVISGTPMVWQRDHAGRPAPEGTFVAGPYVLSVQADNPYAIGQVALDVPAGAVADLGAISIELDSLIFGATRSAAGAVLDLTPCLRDAATGAIVGDVGRADHYRPGFAIGDVPVREVDVAVDDLDWAAIPVRLLPPRGQLQDFTLRTRPGTRVTFVRSGIDIGLVELRVRSVAGLWCWGRELGPESRVSACLEPGRYTLYVERGPAHRPDRIPFDVGVAAVDIAVPTTL